MGKTVALVLGIFALSLLATGFAFVVFTVSRWAVRAYLRLRKTTP